MLDTAIFNFVVATDSIEFFDPARISRINWSQVSGQLPQLQEK
jgi:hypothetical protein